MRITQIDPQGIDWIDYKNNPASNGHDGQELIAKARGSRRVVLTLTCYSAAGTGPTTAMMRLNDVVGAQPLHADAMDKAGAHFQGAGKINAIGGVVNSVRFEPRAIVECVFQIPSEILGFETVIDSVEITNTATGVVLTVHR